MSPITARRQVRQGVWRVFARTVGAMQEFGGDETEILPACYPIEAVTKFEVKSGEIFRSLLTVPLCWPTRGDRSRRCALSRMSLSPRRLNREP